MAEELYLRNYVGIVARHIRFVLLVFVATLVVGAVLSFLSPPSYTAAAAIAIVRSSSQLTFDPKFLTLSEEAIGQSDAKTRRSTLAALVRNSVVESRVVAALGPLLSPGEMEPGGLLAEIDVETEGEIIRIIAHSRDPEKAAKIANSWAQAYESYVNELYATTPQPNTIVRAEAESAWQEYRTAEDQLVAFVGNNQIARLELEIKLRQDLLDSYYSRAQRLDNLLEDANAMRAQLEENPASSSALAGNNLAVLFLRASAFTSSSRLPVQLQMPLEGAESQQVSPQQQLQDLDNLIAVLGAQHQEAFSLTETTPLHGEILALEARLEQEQAKLREMEQTRGLAWETYGTLKRKLAEVSIASQVTGTAVRFADSAIVPKETIFSRVKVNMAAAAVLGLLAGILGALVVDYLAFPKRRPPAGLPS